ALRTDGSVGPAVAVSAGPGAGPRWRPDGSAVIFWDRRDQILSVPITTAPRLVAGTPTTFVDLPKLGLIQGFHVLPPGRLLMVAKHSDEGELQRLDVVLGFGAEVARAAQQQR